jgi:hypothetical protein
MLPVAITRLADRGGMSRYSQEISRKTHFGG